MTEQEAPEPTSVPEQDEPDPTGEPQPPEDDASAPTPEAPLTPDSLAPDVPGATVEVTPPAVVTGVDDSSSEENLHRIFDEAASKR